MKYSLFKKVNQDKNLIKDELENLFKKYNVKPNILQYKEYKDGKFYPGYIEYNNQLNDKAYRHIENLLNKYDWYFFIYLGSISLKENYNILFPIYEENFN